MRLHILFVTLFSLCCIFSHRTFGQDTIVFSDAAKIQSIGASVAILEDKDNKLQAANVGQATQFVSNHQAVPNLQVSGSAFWVRFAITNKTSLHALGLQLDYPTIDSVELIKMKPGGGMDIVSTGEFDPYYRRAFKHQTYIFNLEIPPGETRQYFLKVMASEQMQLPLNLSSVQRITEAINNNDLIFGLYAGLILVMVFYNLFIYFTVRDRTYLYYVFYILFVGLVQACLQGYAPRFLYPDSYFLANAMLVWMPALSGIFGIAFTASFLSVRTYTPVLSKVLTTIQWLYIIILALSFTGNYRLCAQLLLMTVGTLAIIVYITAVRIALKGYRPARFFAFAWTIFIASVVIFVLRNFNVLPYNSFTYYALQIGSACEIVLLSFALADKINIFRKEKEVSQAQAMEALQENERIVREQNVMLEAKVTERTQELEVANDGLNVALTELKDAQSQLVESEKMASLGQLTAGIAHEINNPINFVTSNVKPLNRDVYMLLDTIEHVEKLALENIPAEEKQRQIDEYKADIDFDYLKLEIEQLLSGIGSGAARTAEIVKGLRIFSRLDEDDLKKADINEGLDSTLIIANNILGGAIKLKKNFGNLPLIECYPGKLNQVFLNVISNAVYAIKKKFEEKEGGELTITTSRDEQSVKISIKDNGIGMDEQVKRRLFEPFFTTKDVGEGTGLGLSIAYNTISKHNGQIAVNSETGIGTEFILTLPLMQK